MTVSISGARAGYSTGRNIHNTAPVGPVTPASDERHSTEIRGGAESPARTPDQRL